MSRKIQERDKYAVAGMVELMAWAAVSTALICSVAATGAMKGRDMPSIYLLFGGCVLIARAVAIWVIRIVFSGSSDHVNVLHKRQIGLRAAIPYVWYGLAGVLSGVLPGMPANVRWLTTMTAFVLAFAFAAVTSRYIGASGDTTNAEQEQDFRREDTTQ